MSEPVARASYHHGNLTEALLEAAVGLIEERGVEGLSVREVARRAGVSPGAPFRHYRSKTALLTAVAEQAMTRLTETVRVEVVAQAPADPLQALMAIGRAYLRWARSNPTHFQIISSRSLIDFHGSALLVEENEALRLRMIELFNSAKAQGLIREGYELADFLLAARAFVYGLSRMWIDGHFREWKVETDPEQAMESALRLFLSGLSADAR